MQDTYVISTTFRYAEYLKFIFYFIRNTAYLRKPVLIFLLMGILAAIPFLLKAAPWDQILFMIFIPLASVSIFIILFLPIVLFIVIKMKPQYMNSEYRFTNWGIERTSLGTEQSLPWRKIVKLEETKSHFFLYIQQPQDIHLIQKEKFETPAQVDTFRILVKERIISGRE